MTFSLVYVFANADKALGFFYRLTAFWAGQEGSLLFWAWTVALCGAAFPLMRGYKTLPEEAKLWYWVFYGTVLAFFCLVLTAWSNPFQAFSPAPADGSRLGHILQNPGMIFHPPCCFWGTADSPFLPAWPLPAHSATALVTAKPPGRSVPDPLFS